MPADSAAAEDDSVGPALSSVPSVLQAAEAGKEAGAPASIQNALKQLGGSQQTPLDRRLEWLQKDFNIIKTRANNTLATIGSSNTVANAHSMSKLQGYASQLQAELAEEREWREKLEVELAGIETVLGRERSERERALGTLAAELEETMKSLVRRIDVGLSDGTQELSARAAKTEAGLKTLIMRVEEGLESGAKALQETLQKEGVPNGRRGVLPSPAVNLAGIRASALQTPALRDFLQNSDSKFPPSTTPSTADAPIISRQSSSHCFSVDESIPGSTRSISIDGVTAPANAPVADPLLKVWSELQEENMRLRQKRVQLEAKQMRSRLQSRSPTIASKCNSPPAIGSRNRSPPNEKIGGGLGTLGTGFRWRTAGPHGDKESVDTSLKLGNQMAFGLGLKSNDARDSDAVSTTSSLPTSASVQNQAQNGATAPEGQEAASSMPADRLSVSSASAATRQFSVGQTAASLAGQSRQHSSVVGQMPPPAVQRPNQMQVRSSSVRVQRGVIVSGHTPAASGSTTPVNGGAKQGPLGLQQQQQKTQRVGLASSPRQRTQAAVPRTVSSTLSLASRIPPAVRGQVTAVSRNLRVGAPDVESVAPTLSSKA